MELPADILKRVTTPAPHAPRSEREEIVSLFLERLNRSREGSKFKPLTYARLAKMLEGVPTSDLYPFLRLCEGAKSFSAFFWSSLKKKQP